MELMILSHANSVVKKQWMFIILIQREWGGSKLKDYIENLIALCRKCHIMAHDSELSQSDLLMLHRRRMGGVTTGVMGKKL